MSDKKYWSTEQLERYIKYQQQAKNTAEMRIKAARDILERHSNAAFAAFNWNRQDVQWLGYLRAVQAGL